MKTELTASRAREALHYDPGTGEFTWLVSNTNSVKVGQRAGAFSKSNGWVICIDSVYYKAHRIAFLMMTGDWPMGDVDHRDLNNANNSWANLRVASRAQNMANRLAPSNNTSGFKGVAAYETEGRWKAGIKVNNKRIHLGCFDTREEAAEAYYAAALKYYGPFARLEAS